VAFEFGKPDMSGSANSDFATIDTVNNNNGEGRLSHAMTPERKKKEIEVAIS
jgi:hypothetical protein